MKTKETIIHIADWLSEYADNSKTKGFVIGISGGIDSAVTSTLCALTGKDVICLNMPIHQHKAEFDRSSEHIKWLCEKFPNVSASTVDLTDTFEMYSKSIPEDIQDHLSMANARARLRMTSLYSYAGHYNMLVAGTGNKIEDFGIGFYTKYGDGGVDLSPIADLLKSEVYALAAEIGIVENIQKAAPTDGLWDDGRSDEDQIGASYNELEWAMNWKGNENNLSERELIVLGIYRQKNKANQHKMNPIPVCEIPRELK